MLQAASLVTVASIFAVSPDVPDEGPFAELLVESHVNEGGVEIDLYATRDADGDPLAEATLCDPERPGTEIEVWTDGVTVEWSGTIDSQPVGGSMAAVDFGDDPQAAAFCFTPVTALICLGAAAVLAGSEGCAHTSWCTRRDDPTEVPGGAGGVPDDHGGGGDGEDESGDAGGD